MKQFLYIATIILLLAVIKMPYGFYQLLRLIAMTAFLIIAYREFKQSGWNTWVTLGIIGVLVFNPLVPIRFSKGMWQIIDTVTAVIVGMYAYRLPSE